MKIQNVTDASFGRYGKVVTEFSYQEILKEMKELENVKNVGFSEDLSLLKVETKNGLFPEVMNRAVNICRRIGGGCDLSFAGFVC